MDGMEKPVALAPNYQRKVGWRFSYDSWGGGKVVKCEDTITIRIFFIFIFREQT